MLVQPGGDFRAGPGRVPDATWEFGSMELDSTREYPLAMSRGQQLFEEARRGYPQIRTPEAQYLNPLHQVPNPEQHNKAKRQSLSVWSYLQSMAVVGLLQLKFLESKNIM